MISTRPSPFRLIYDFLHRVLFFFQFYYFHEYALYYMTRTHREERFRVVACGPYAKAMRGIARPHKKATRLIWGQARRSPTGLDYQKGQKFVEQNFNFMATLTSSS